LQVKAELAGKAIKCPGCGKTIKVAGAPAAKAAAAAPSPKPAAPPPPVSAAPAAQEDDWIDITEAADPAEVAAAMGRPAAAAAAPSTPPTGDWGQSLMDDHEVPDEIRDKLHSTLMQNERLIWFDRPRMDILIHQARRYAMIAGPICLAVGAGLVVSSIFLMSQSVAAGIIMLLMGPIIATIGVFAFFAPAKQRKRGPTRACFAITNRRLLIHPGLGKQSRYRGGQAATMLNTGVLGVATYSGLDLSRMQRIDLKRFPGAGDLIFGRNLYDEPAGGDLWALSDVHEVEKIVREQLLHPIIDKILRGKALTGEEKGTEATAGPPTRGDQVIATDANIKDFVGGAGTDQTDPNVKAAAAGRAAYDPDKEEPEVREKLDTELTDGEKVLWVGEPEGKTQGRGMLGAITGGAERKEPDYDLYALTNRRVLLWQTRGSREGKSLMGSSEVRGPLSYYPPHVLGAGLEEDKRIKDGGGSIIFKQVKRTIDTQDKQGRVKTRVELHYFGLLRIRRHRAVGRLLYETLIAPCRALSK
jgi:hypothetical protein